MADISITIVVPDAYVGVVKLAVEHFAYAHGDLEPPDVFTSVTGKAYIKTLMIRRLLELVKAYKQDQKTAVAMSEAAVETNAIVIG